MVAVDFHPAQLGSVGRKEVPDVRHDLLVEPREGLLLSICEPAHDGAQTSAVLRENLVEEGRSGATTPRWTSYRPVNDCAWDRKIAS